MNLDRRKAAIERLRVDEATLNTSGPNTTDVIYEVFGYVDGGNLQIHPPTGFDR